MNALKEAPQKIQPGRVKVLNVVQEYLTKSQLITIQPGSTVALVFDTDVKQTDCLKENINRLKKFCSKVKIIYLPQVLNFEDEIVRCSDIKSITDLTHSKSTKDFKRDFCAMSNVRQVLEKANLKVERLWTETPSKEFSFFSENSQNIKL